MGGCKYRRTLQVSVRSGGGRATWAGVGFLWCGMEVTGKKQLNWVWPVTNWVGVRGLNEPLEGWGGMGVGRS